MNSLVTDLNNRPPLLLSNLYPPPSQPPELTILYSKLTGNPLPSLRMGKRQGRRIRGQMYDWKERSHVSQQVWICTRCIVRGAAEQLCATLGTKLAQSRETLVAAAPVSASSWCCQLSLSVAVSLFLLQRVLCRGIRDRWLFRLARPAPPRGFGSVVVAGSEDQHCASSH